MPAGPGRSVTGMRPADIMAGQRPDRSSGTPPGPGAVVPAGAVNVRPADIVAEAGGHHVGAHPGHRHRHSEIVARAVPTDYNFVPVWNPADFDKGITSHSLAASSSSAVSATTQSTTAVGAAPDSSAFWHTAGAVFQAGRTIATYYMGNDPCRVASGRRRMVATAESQLAVRTDETFDQWNERNASLIVSRGGSNRQLALAMYQRNEPPSQTQHDCVAEPEAANEHLEPVLTRPRAPTMETSRTTRRTRSRSCCCWRSRPSP